MHTHGLQFRLGAEKRVQLQLPIMMCGVLVFLPPISAAESKKLVGGGVGVGAIALQGALKPLLKKCPVTFSDASS